MNYLEEAKKFGGTPVTSDTKINFLEEAKKMGGAPVPTQQINYLDAAKQFGGMPVAAPDSATRDTVTNPFAVEGAAAAPVVDKSLSPIEETVKGVKSGISSVKSIPTSTGAFVDVGAALTNLNIASLYDKIDKGEITDPLQIKAGSDFETSRARMYLNSKPETRKVLRDKATQEVASRKENIQEAVNILQQYQKENLVNKGRTQDLTDVEGVKDFANWAAFNLGSGGVQLVPIIAAAVTTGGLGVFATGTTMELSGGVQNRLNYIVDKTKDIQDPKAKADAVFDYLAKSGDVTLASAIASGAVDVILGPAAELIKRPAAQLIKEQTRKEIAKEIPKAVIKQGGEEFLAGGIQETIQIAAERALGEQTGDFLTKENIKRIVNAAAAESVAGGAYGGGAKAVQAAFAKPSASGVNTSTAEGRAMAGLDALAASEEAATTAATEATTRAKRESGAGAAQPLRTLDSLTTQEVSNIERQLFAELGRAPTAEELEGAFNEYIAEQNAGLGVESGASVAGVSDTGAEQPAGAAGVSDTGAAATPDAGGLGVSGVSTGQLEAGTTEQLGALEEAETLYTELSAESDAAWEEYQAAKNAYEALTENTPEDVQAEIYNAYRATRDKWSALTDEAIAAKENYNFLLEGLKTPEQIADESTEGIPSTEDVEAAAPEAEEVITEGEPASVEALATSYADELFEANPDYDVEEYDAAETKLFEDLKAQGLTDQVARDTASKVFSDRLVELDEGREGKIFKSLTPTPATYISPAVGSVPTNKFGINRLNKLYSDGKISAQEYADGMIKLYEELEDKAIKKSMSRGLKRERGLGAVIKALEDAVKKGRISEETAEFAKWLLLQNPAIAADLAISIKIPQTVRAQEQNAGVAGFYSDMARLVRIITRKNEDGKYLATPSDVAVHEILHHMERMLPTELRALIREEWKVRVQKAMDKAVKENNLEVIKYLALVVNGNAAQSSGVMQEAENMIKDGRVPHSYYGFINTSEFWAVNGSNILAGRYGAETRLQKLRQYVKEFIEKIKSIFGLDTDDPIIRGLNAVLKGDGTFLQKQMLADSRGGPRSPSLTPEGRTTADTEISEDEKKLQEQFRRSGDLQPDVVEAIRNNDLNGALNILANRLGGFYGELAAKLASLNLQTSIAFDNGNNLTYRAVEQTVGPQLQRVMNYMRVADPNYYDNWFKDFDRPENLIRLRTGINTLYFDTVIAKGKGKHSFTEIANEIKDVSDAIYKYDVTGAAGAYYNLFDAISLNTKNMAGMGNRVFLHEVVHAATVSILRADPSQLTKEQLDAREEIEKLYRLAQRNIKVGEYGLTNRFEFLAELFTNEEFQKLLKAIPYPPARTNVLSRFFNAILRLVGADNLASRAMVEAEKLFTATRYQEAKPIGPLFAQGKKRRVRGPISTPDTYRTASDQQSLFLQTMKDAYDGRMEWKDAIKILGPALWDSKNAVLRGATLPVLNLTHLEDLTRNKFTQLTGALKIIRDMVAYRAKKMNAAGEILTEWTKLQKKNFAQSQLMSRIMLEATIRGVDPDTATSGTLNPAFQKAWNALKPEYKEIYRKVRDFYSDSVTQMVQEMKRRAAAIPDPVARAEMLKKIDDQFGPNNLVKPYFPLRRFGQYWFQVGSGNFKEFYEFENPVSRDIAMRRRIRELSKGNAQQKKLAETIAKGNGISDLYGRNVGTTQVLKDVQELVDGVSASNVTDLKDQLQDSLNQLIYLLLPQQSMRKMFINRKAIQGASSDMLRVFATTAVHSAYQQSRFMFAEKFLQNLNNARSEIDDAQKVGMLDTDTAAAYKDFILEVEKRVPTVMSNEDTSFTAQVAGKASELTFYYMLSAPFTAILNTIGAVQLAMPYIGGSYGYAKANARLLKNMGRYLGTSPTRTFMPLAKGVVSQVNFPSIVEGAKLPPLLRRAADRFLDDGVIDISLTNDIFELGDRPSQLYTGIGATVKKVMSGLFHQSERMNREILLLTTFELAYEKAVKDYQRQPGMEGLRGVYLRDAQGNKTKNTPDQAFEIAIQEATRVAALTLGDYSRQMKGRIFSNPIANLLLKFKQYPILALFAVYRNLQMGYIEPFKKAELDQYRALLEKELVNDPNRDQVIEQRMEEVEAQRKALSKEARRRLAGILGVSMILGGQVAMPYFSLVLGTLVKMFAGEDEDEYFDWENWFYNYMETEFGGYLGAMLANAGVKPDTAEKAGRTAAEIVTRGVPSAMGAALADRISLDPKALLWRDGRFSPDARENFIESIIANSGPVVGLGLNFTDAYQLAKDGQYGRAAEKALPAIIAKPLSAARMSEEGAKTKGGDVLINDFTMTELALQAIGLQPERLAQKQKAAASMKLKEQKILAERSAIMDRLWMERDNPDAYAEQYDRALDFSEKYPDAKITPRQIRESFKKRQKDAMEAEMYGARIDKRLRAQLGEMGEFAEDEE